MIYSTLKAFHLSMPSGLLTNRSKIFSNSILHEIFKCIRQYAVCHVHNNTESDFDLFNMIQNHLTFKFKIASNNKRSYTRFPELESSEFFQKLEFCRNQEPSQLGLLRTTCMFACRVTFHHNLACSVGWWDFSNRSQYRPWLGEVFLQAPYKQA